MTVFINKKGKESESDLDKKVYLIFFLQLLHVIEIIVSQNVILQILFPSGE